jgi:hypothetical protein
MLIGTVVTTIQSPTPSLSDLSKGLEVLGENLYIIGDKKSPSIFEIPFGRYYSPQAQKELSFSLVDVLPWNSYARKMLGYLLAVADGCSHIRETDDDNSPLGEFFDPVPQLMDIRVANGGNLWINPYSFFSQTDIWPRGLPLENVLTENRNFVEGSISADEIGVLQGLANGSPDVDAVYRLTRSDVSDFVFEENTPLLIPRDCYTPFNSQATIWNVELLPLMYLPSTCSFRMTDIWRSFIALRVMRETKYSIVFTNATMHQDRNQHDLLKDFESEVSGYLGNAKIIEVLEQISFSNSTESNSDKLKIIYSKLVESGFLKEAELEILDAWLEDCSNLSRNLQKL